MSNSTSTSPSAFNLGEHGEICKPKIPSKSKSKTKKPRCFHCKGKLGPVKFECKCSTKKLCIKCRLPESHNCQYDFKKESRQFLENKLVKVTHDKVIKI